MYDSAHGVHADDGHTLRCDHEQGLSVERPSTLCQNILELAGTFAIACHAMLSRLIMHGIARRSVLANI